jgi:hypothetical protein
MPSVASVDPGLRNIAADYLQPRKNFFRHFIRGVIDYDSFAAYLQRVRTDPASAQPRPAHANSVGATSRDSRSDRGEVVSHQNPNPVGCSHST